MVPAEYGICKKVWTLCWESAEKLDADTGSQEAKNLTFTFEVPVFEHVIKFSTHRLVTPLIVRNEAVWCKSSQIWQQTNLPRHAATCVLASRTRLNYSFTAAGRVESNLQLSAVTSLSASTATPGRKPPSSSAVKLQIWQLKAAFLAFSHCSAVKTRLRGS